jgi:predicted metal-binding membrane protein
MQEVLPPREKWLIIDVLVMFVMRLMSFVWMGILTVGIFLEQITPYGSTLSKVIGGILILLGVGILLHPGLMQYLTA